MTSIRTKLLVFAALLVVVPGLLFGWIAERNARDSLERTIGNQLAREAGHTAERLAALLDQERKTLTSFARQDLMREIRVGDIDKRISSALMTLRDGSPVRLDYLVVGGAREVVASSNPMLIGELPSWPPLAHAAAGLDAALQGPLASPAHSEALAVLTSTPVPDPDGDGGAIGVLVGLYDWGRLTGVTQEVRDELAGLGLSTSVLVLGEAGTVLGGSGVGGLPPDVAARSWSDEAGYVVLENAGLLVGSARLGSGAPRWRLLIVESLAEALAPVRALRSRLLVTQGLALLVAVALATWGAGRLVHPLSELTTAIGRLSLGDPSAERVPVRTDDEVGALATAFNRMAGDLDQAQRDLVDAAKFAFVGELAAGVAHEVRTSLGVLRSSAQILQRSIPADGPDDSVELAELIRAEVDRLGGVVDDLLSLARPREARLEAVRITEPIFRAVDLIDPQAHEKGVTIHRAPDAEDLMAWCDSELLYQVTLNLLVNGVHALGTGGRIDVRTFRASDGFVGFEVVDDGPGIPEEIRDQVFLPFVTAREGGVGLGLTFVRRVVHEHRGRIAVETGTGAGTRFRIELPPAEESP